MSDFDVVRRRAATFLSAGLNASLNLISTVTSTATGGRNDDSSDDEETRPSHSIDEETESLLQQYKTLYQSFVFETTKQDSGKIKHVFIHLGKGKLYTFGSTGSERKTIAIHDIQRCELLSEYVVCIEVRRAMEVQMRVKKYVFAKEDDAERFAALLEYYVDFGKVLRTAFATINTFKTGKISREELRQAVRRVDLHVENRMIDEMMEYAKHENEQVDFFAFFHLIYPEFVSSVRDCLQLWLVNANEFTTTPDRSSLCSTRSYKRSTLRHECRYLIPGEELAMTPKPAVYWCVQGGKINKQPYFIPGDLFVTSYRMILTSNRKLPLEQPMHSRYDVPDFFKVCHIPLASIQRIYVGAPHNSLFIVGKDYRQVRITFTGVECHKNKVESVLTALSHLTFCTPNTKPHLHLFAFKYAPDLRCSEAWQLSDVRREYVRQGFDQSSEWQIYFNVSYSLSESYPKYLVLPRHLSEAQIKAAAGFRSRGRLPAVVYRHSRTQAVLTRSAQPLVGITQKTCEDDERLLDLYRTKGKMDNVRVNQHSKLYIMDARGKIAATLNMAAGKGTEDVTMYQNTELVFGNIDNIHVMRSSAQMLAEELNNSNSHVHVSGKEMLPSNEGVVVSSSNVSRLEETGWLKHVRYILISSMFVAEKLHFEGASVLVHCSDGWDRTAQICSIAQLLLDPYYRTLQGFATLVEKEWCAFGHKFQDRCGQGQDPNHLPDERSPVFIQFLECVYQLLVQFPFCFQFTDQLLVFLADHVHSCLFGNFLGNSESYRMETLKVCETTVSIWTYVFSHQARFLQDKFMEYAHPLWPSCSIHRMAVWSRYWARWDIAAHPHRLTGCWEDDWGSLVESPVITIDAALRRASSLALTEDELMGDETNDNGEAAQRNEEDVDDTNGHSMKDASFEFCTSANDGDMDADDQMLL